MDNTYENIIKNIIKVNDDYNNKPNRRDRLDLEDFAQAYMELLGPCSKGLMDRYPSNVRAGQLKHCKNNIEGLQEFIDTEVKILSAMGEPNGNSANYTWATNRLEALLQKANGFFSSGISGNNATNTNATTTVGISV